MAGFSTLSFKKHWYLLIKLYGITTLRSVTFTLKVPSINRLQKHSWRSGEFEFELILEEMLYR
jgi:hypothetical protein